MPGKSIIAHSITDTFPENKVGDMYQGVNNNFMFMNCLQKSVILAEETKFASLQGETWKLVMEGTRQVTFAVKNGPNEFLEPTPIIFTNNGYPWDTMTRIQEKEAFMN